MSRVLCQGMEPVTTSQKYWPVWLLEPCLGTYFWHNTPDIWLRMVSHCANGINILKYCLFLFWYHSILNHILISSYWYFINTNLINTYRLMQLQYFHIPVRWTYYGHKVQWFILVHSTRATIIRNSFLTPLNSSFESPEHWGGMVPGCIGSIPEHFMKMDNPLGINKILLYFMENGILYVATIPTGDCTNNQPCAFVIKFSLNHCILYSRMIPSGTHDVAFTNSH